MIYRVQLVRLQYEMLELVIEKERLSLNVARAVTEIIFDPGNDFPAERSETGCLSY